MSSNHISDKIKMKKFQIFNIIKTLLTNRNNKFLITILSIFRLLILWKLWPRSSLLISNRVSWPRVVTLRSRAIRREISRKWKKSRLKLTNSSKNSAIWSPKLISNQMSAHLSGIWIQGVEIHSSGHFFKTTLRRGNIHSILQGHWMLQTRR